MVYGIGLWLPPSSWPTTNWTARSPCARLGLDAPTRIGFVNTVLGSGLALLEEQAIRSRTGLATDADLASAAAPPG
jgi:hypothetical protein